MLTAEVLGFRGCSGLRRLGEGLDDCLEARNPLS